MIRRLRIWWRRWRLTPGMKMAAGIAESTAWGHPNASMLGPEMNLMDLAKRLRREKFE